MTECICNNENFMLERECVICHIKNNEKAPQQLRKYLCNVHKVIECCGLYEYVCNNCKEEGWYSTAGFGGPTQHVNSKTNERRTPVSVKNSSPFIITGSDIF